MHPKVATIAVDAVVTYSVTESEVSFSVATESECVSSVTLYSLYRIEKGSIKQFGPQIRTQI